MKNLVIIIATILSLTATAQTAKEIEMVTLVNQVRTNPKSFVPAVEAYIKTLEEKQNCGGMKIKITGAVVTKKSTTVTGNFNGLIAEAKKLIVFLNTQKPIKALELSLTLSPIARTQAEYIDSIKTLTHNGLNESTTKRFTKGFTLSGENCAVGTTATNAMIELLVDYGVANKGHRTNIFNKAFTKIAIGNSNEYWVQDFAF